MNVYVDITDATRSEQFHMLNTASRYGFKQWANLLPHYHIIAFSTESVEENPISSSTVPNLEGVIRPEDFAARLRKGTPKQGLKNTVDLYNKVNGESTLTPDDEDYLNKEIESLAKQGINYLQIYPNNVRDLYKKLGHPNVIKKLKHLGYKVKDHPKDFEMLMELEGSGHIVEHPAHRDILW